MTKFTDTFSNAMSFGRRALLRRSLWGGAAVAASAFGAVDAATAAEEVRALIDPKGEGFRRVVTGNNAAGKTYIMKDEKIKYGEIWRSSNAEILGPGGPGDPNGVVAATRDLTPGQQVNTRWYYSAMPVAKGPYDRATIELHRTSALSYVLFTSGQVRLVLDEGDVMLRSGDFLILRNGHHAWHNPGPEPTGMLIAMSIVG